MQIFLLNLVINVVAEIVKHALIELTTVLLTRTRLREIEFHFPFRKRGIRTLSLSFRRKKDLK